MFKLRKILPKSAVVSLLLSGVLPALAWAGDLSSYRDFQLGTDLPTVAKQAGAKPSEARVIHRRPALIQELAWRPQSLGSSSRAEAAKEVVFTFYEGELFRVVVDYDRFATEGMTADDFVEAISATYGTAARPTVAAKAEPPGPGDPDEILAQWQDSRYRFDLIRSSYGPGFRLVGIVKGLEAPVRAATLEAERLDVQETPQRDAARLASEDAAAKSQLEKARFANKPQFRP